MAAEEGRGFISHMQADFADQRDCTLLPSIVASDINHSNGLNYALLDAYPRLDSGLRPL